MADLEAEQQQSAVHLVTLEPHFPPTRCGNGTFRIQSVGQSNGSATEYLDVCGHPSRATLCEVMFKGGASSDTNTRVCVQTSHHASGFWCISASDSHDGLEVVVHQDHVRRLLAHVGARLAHRHADVGGLQSHGVVHPVARHCHHGAEVLEGLQRGRTFTARGSALVS